MPGAAGGRRRKSDKDIICRGKYIVHMYVCRRMGSFESEPGLGSLPYLCMQAGRGGLCPTYPSRRAIFDTYPNMHICTPYSIYIIFFRSKMPSVAHVVERLLSVPLGAGSNLSFGILFFVPFLYPFLFSFFAIKIHRDTFYLQHTYQQIDVLIVGTSYYKISF